MPDPLAGFTYPQPNWPYPTGYATVEDVQSRINAGVWDPSKPTAAPNTEQVQQWLMEATANVDVALRTRGYFVPLQPSTGWAAPPGMASQLYQGIGLGAWLQLKNICACYAAHFVQLSRYGTHSANKDTHAEEFMAIFDDFLTRIESAADNLIAFGVGGDFPPEIDIAKGAQTGSLGATLADPTSMQGPIFTKGMPLGSGYEQLSPSGPPGSTGSGI
jgi:hypothetical protein